EGVAGHGTGDIEHAAAGDGEVMAGGPCGVVQHATGECRREIELAAILHVDGAGITRAGSRRARDDAASEHVFDTTGRHETIADDGARDVDDAAAAGTNKGCGAASRHV